MTQIDHHEEDAKWPICVIAQIGHPKKDWSENAIAQSNHRKMGQVLENSTTKKGVEFADMLMVHSANSESGWPKIPMGQNDHLTKFGRVHS